MWGRRRDDCATTATDDCRATDDGRTTITDDCATTATDDCRATDGGRTTITDDCATTDHDARHIRGALCRQPGCRED